MPSVDEHKVFLLIAQNISEMSYAKRKKVGAVLVRDGRIISTGFNGTPSGMDNSCEYDRTVYNNPDDPSKNSYETLTKPEVIHAEANAILAAAKHGISTNNSILYLTMSPCVNCVKMIIQSGIKKVYYSEDYRKHGGVKLLVNNNIPCVKI